MGTGRQGCTGAQGRCDARPGRNGTLPPSSQAATALNASRLARRNREVRAMAPDRRREHSCLSHRPAVTSETADGSAAVTLISSPGANTYWGQSPWSDPLLKERDCPTAMSVASSATNARSPSTPGLIEIGALVEAAGCRVSFMRAASPPASGLALAHPGDPGPGKLLGQRGRGRMVEAVDGNFLRCDRPGRETVLGVDPVSGPEAPVRRQAGVDDDHVAIDPLDDRALIGGHGSLRRLSASVTGRVRQHREPAA